MRIEHSSHWLGAILIRYIIVSSVSSCLFRLVSGQLARARMKASSSSTKRVVHMCAHAQKRTISGGCTQAGSPVSSSSGPKIMVVISCTVGKGISTGWMDAIFPFCKNTPGNIGMCYVRFCAWKEVLKHQIFP